MVRVRVRVSRGHGYHVLYVPTLFFDLFLPVAYTSSNPKVYGSFRFWVKVARSVISLAAGGKRGAIAACSTDRNDQVTISAFDSNLVSMKLIHF